MKNKYGIRLLSSALTYAPSKAKGQLKSYAFEMFLLEKNEISLTKFL